MKIEIVKTCVYLPKTHVQVSQFYIQILYFLQNCKKSKTIKVSLSLWYPKTQYS